jgi:hypothetical protein
MERSEDERWERTGYTAAAKKEAEVTVGNPE